MKPARPHVTINGKTAAGTEVKIGDGIEIRFGAIDKLKVLSTEEHVTKEGAGTVYDIVIRIPRQPGTVFGSTHQPDAGPDRLPES